MGKKKILGKLAKKALSFTPAPVRIGAKALGGAGKLLGLGKGRGRRSRGLNLTKYANRLIRAKMSAKLMKVKMSAFKGI